MRGLIDELGQLLLPEDPRWYAFGLSRPSDPETLGVRDSLVLTAGTQTTFNVLFGKKVGTSLRGPVMAALDTTAADGAFHVSTC